MKSAFFTMDFYEFFIELSMNNHKSWFDLNRKRYESDVKLRFENFIEHLIEKMSEINDDFKELRAKDCIFRINKDIRFSRDKQPYKLFCSASIHKGGRKSMTPGGIYLELGPEKCAIYSGVYMPEREELHKIRMNISNNLEGFNSAINEADFLKYFGSVLGEKNKKIDVVFKDASQSQNLLFNKQFYVMHEFEAERTLNTDFLTYTTSVWTSSQNFNKIIGGTY